MAIEDTKQQLSTPTAAAKVTEGDLNRAAALLLQQIPEHARELVDILATEAAAPIWQIVAGIVLEAHMEGRMSAYTIDPDWRLGLVMSKFRKCEQCGKTFKPTYLGQPYCSNLCGEKAVGLYKEEPKDDGEIINPDTVKSTDYKSDAIESGWTDVAPGEII